MFEMRITRRIAAGIVLSALVFAQLAVAAHACPALDTAVEAAQPADAAAPPCHDLENDRSALCQAHCQDGQQNVNDTQPAFAPPRFVPGLIVTIDSAAHNPSQARPNATLLLRFASPPITIRNRCFRI